MDNRTLKRDFNESGRKMKDAASNASYHIGRNNVTHTMNSIKNVIREAAFVLGFIEKRRAFGKRFDTAIMQAQVGPVETQIRGPDIFIQGTFNLETLRKFIVVNDPTDIIVIEPQGPINEKK